LVRQVNSEDVQLLASYACTPAPLQPPAPVPAGGPEEARRRSCAPPKDLGKWKEVVTAVVKRTKEIGLPFGIHEVWNEPDGTYEFFTGTEADYEQVYKATVEAVRAVDPDAVVAGPSADHHMLWNMGFVDFVYRAQVDKTITIPDLAKFQVRLKELAPAGWAGKAHISFLMRNTGPGTRAKFTVRAGK
jgi:hypothetical protein